LEERKDFRFLTYPQAHLPPDLSSYVLLSIDAPPLNDSDAGKGLFVLDATWRYAEKMMKFVDSHVHLERRSLPRKYRTAYPRRQEDCPYPELGLASIEAIYGAYLILGRNVEGLLDHYHWRGEFLLLNCEERIQKI
jgi:pre-rRNA-processing protein TSR3